MKFQITEIEITPAIVRSRREALGLRVGDLAVLAKVKPSAVDDLENGISQSHASNAQDAFKILAALDVAERAA